MEMEDFIRVSYAFMTGLPGFGGGGFCMMGPDELKRQRLGYVKRWQGMLVRDMREISTAARSRK